MMLAASSGRGRKRASGGSDAVQSHAGQSHAARRCVGLGHVTRLVT